MRLRHNRDFPNRSRLTALSWLLLFLALVCLSSTAISQPAVSTVSLPVTSSFSTPS